MLEKIHELMKNKITYKEDDLNAQRYNSLHHFNKYPDHPWLKSKEDIIIWLDENIMNKYQKQSYIINEDLTVNTREAVFIENKSIEYIPIQFNICIKGFVIINSKLKSLIGTPYYTNAIKVDGNCIENFLGLSKNVKSNISLLGNKLNSFYGMPKIENNICLNLENNPDIKSWNGFNIVGEVDLIWWQNIVEKNTIQLIYEKPDAVKNIKFHDSFNKEIKEKSNFFKTRFSYD